MKKINLPDALFFISDGSILYKRFGNDGLFRHRMNLVSIMKTERERKKNIVERNSSCIKSRSENMKKKKEKRKCEYKLGHFYFRFTDVKINDDGWIN